jgi:hypothetical protein
MYFRRVDKPVGASTIAVVDALSLIHPTNLLNGGGIPGFRHAPE